MISLYLFGIKCKIWFMILLSHFHIRKKASQKIENPKDHLGPMCQLAENILSLIVSELKISNLDLSTAAINKDGRVNSSILENIVSNNICNNLQIKEMLNTNNIRIEIPKEREWYDFCIVSNISSASNVFIPVNIKISALKTADNVSSKKGLYYACTGIIPGNLDFEGIKQDENRLITNKWTDFYDKLYHDADKNTDADYYFLIVNKNNNTDIFYTSLKTLDNAVPNGNNLPFLCNWDKNRSRVFKSQKDARTYLMSIFYSSLQLSYVSVKLGLKILKKLSKK